MRFRVPIRRGVNGERIAEFKNVFNNRQTSTVNGVMSTDTAGDPLTAIPATANDFPIAGRSGYEARQFQVGFTFDF
jgi:hypothetical protein